MFAKQDTGDLYIPQAPSHKETSYLLDLGTAGDKGQRSSSHDQRDQPLEKCYDFLCDNESYKVSCTGGIVADCTSGIVANCTGGMVADCMGGMVADCTGSMVAEYMDI